MTNKINNIECIDAGPMGKEQQRRIAEILAEGIYTFLKAEGKAERESVCKQEKLGPLDKEKEDSYNYIKTITPLSRKSDAQENHDHPRRRSVLLPFEEDPHNETEEPESYPRVVDPSIRG